MERNILFLGKDWPLDKWAGDEYKFVESSEADAIRIADELKPSMVVSQGQIAESVGLQSYVTARRWIYLLPNQSREIILDNLRRYIAMADAYEAAGSPVEPKVPTIEERIAILEADVSAMKSAKP